MIKILNKTYHNLTKKKDFDGKPKSLNINILLFKVKVKKIMGFKVGISYMEEY